METTTEIEARPRFEGSNICTWIGFKHVMYLVEEAVLDYLRRSGLVPRWLYEEQGLAVEIVDSDVRILHALHMDDVVRTQVVRQPTGPDGELVFRTTSHVVGAEAVKTVTATVRVLFRSTPGSGTVPAGIVAHTVDRIDRANGADRPVPAAANERGPVAPTTGDAVRLLNGRGSVDPVTDGNAIVWRWRIPYFYCHFSQRLQHSGYLRIMEEVVDLFLAERGISIRTMLDGRRWIPVVPRARLTILREAHLEEQIHTVFTVTDIFKSLTYTARMDCFVRRGADLVRTATGEITHGYAVVLDRRDWRLVPFDERTLAALRGDDRRPQVHADEGGAS